MCDDGNGKKSYQIWINNKDAGFSLGQEGQLPSGIQSVSFADMGKQDCSFLLELFNEGPQTETVQLTLYFRPAPPFPRPVWDSTV
jgi:hypothetical protein